MDYSTTTIASADEFADQYESYVNERKWIGPEILFKEMKDFIAPGQHILDIGIGTGICSSYFFSSGLSITGIDGSARMIQKCAKKGITEELIQWDVSKGLPAINKSFDHIICFAVLHMIKDLGPIFKDCGALLSTNGYFGFSVIEYNPETDRSFRLSNIPGIYVDINKDSGIHNFRHTDNYIHQIVEDTNFTITQKLTFMGFKDEEENREVYFTLYMVKNINQE